MVPTKNACLGELLDSLAQEDRTSVLFNLQDATIGEDLLRVTPIVDEKPLGKQRSFPLSGEFRNSLLRLLAAPSGHVLDRLKPATRQGVYEDLIADGLRGSPGSASLPPALKLMLIDGEPLGFVDGSLHAISNEDFARCIRDGAHSAGFDLDQAQVRSASVVPQGLHIEVSFGRLATEPVVGDFVEFGLSLRHSSVGSFATGVEHFGYRLLCRNGWTAPVCLSSSGQRPRLRRGGEATQEKYLEGIRSATARALREAQERMAAVGRLAEERVDLAATVNSLTTTHRWSRAVRRELLEGIQQGDHGGDETAYGVVNLLTRLGTHGPRSSRNKVPQSVRTRMQNVAGVMAGQAVHRCPQCQRILSGAN